MDEDSVRTHAQGHADAVVGGDLKRAGSWLAPEAMGNVGAVMQVMPKTIDKGEVLGVTAEQDEAAVRIRYTGDNKEVTVDSRWAERDGRPMIVDLTLAGDGS